MTTPALQFAYIYRKSMAKGYYGATAWSGATVKALLLKSTYNILKTDEFVSDLTTITNECSGGTYARQAVTGKASTTDTIQAPGGGSYSLTASSIAFGSLTLADWRWLVFYVEVGTDGTSPLLLAYDFGAQSAAAETLTFSSGVWASFLGLG